MEKLRFAKSEKLDTDGTSTDMYRLRRDPLLGNFDPEKDFDGEIIVNHLFTDGYDLTKITSVEKVVRITRCHVLDASKCPWKWGPAIIGDTRCLAVLQVNPLHDCDISHRYIALCKAHVSKWERKEKDYNGKL